MAKGIKFKDVTAAYTLLTQDIKAGRLKPVYLLMGDESYFIDQLTATLADNILSESERSFNQVVVYGKDTDEDTIINLARQMPMMGRYEVVIVKEAQQLKSIDRLSLYTRHLSPTTILIICYKGKSIDKRLTLYKQIAKSGVVFESARPYDNEIGSWLTDYISSVGCRIEPKALSMLTDHLGTDIAKITNELDKLLTRLPEGTRTITASHIEDNIGVSKEFNNFELTKAIGTRDAQKALRIADYFGRNQKANPMLLTTITLFNYFQKIFIINYRNWQTRVKGMARATDAELATLTKVSPFVIGEYKAAASLYPNTKVFIIMGLIRQYDMKGKGMDSGSAENGDLLRELIMKILML